MKKRSIIDIVSRPGLFFALVMMLLYATGLSAEGGRLSVWVGIEPQAYFVDRIGGSLVDIGVLIQPGQSHEMYDPTPKDIALLSKSDVYFMAGLPFEKGLVEKLSGVTSRFNPVDVKKGIALRPSEEHGHAHDGAEEEEGPDPHTWLDPQLVKTEARQMCDALKRLDSAHAATFEANYASFARDLDRVDSTIAAMLAPYAGGVIYVYHPAYGYFTDRYQLRQAAVEVEGKDPGAEHLGAFIDQARKDRAGTIFVQQEYSARTAEAVAREIGGRVAVLDPMAHDYLENLVRMAASIAEDLKSRKQKR
ncbi:MAG: zinc ABC transporter solute-binding protein [candidate division Zixibacteria bacterium]|nr:zinc ABC transporter solute-binding protein [candidate division Zixibacteria bacterium]